MPAHTRPLADAHLHLQDPVFAPDFEAVMGRAEEAGVRLMICNATGEGDWARVEELGRCHPQIVPCFGIHPWYLEKRSPEWQQKLDRLLRDTPSGVGEAGLDRWYPERDEALQENVFRAQLALARRHRRPVMIHCLKAWGWLMRVLRDEGSPPAGMLIHAYGGPVELIVPLAELGAYFSFAGNVLDDRKTRMRGSLLAVPRARLLLETDAPDLAPPQPFRPYWKLRDNGHYRNEPANLAAILLGVAALRKEPPELLSEALWENVARLFGDVIASRNVPGGAGQV